MCACVSSDLCLHWAWHSWSMDKVLWQRPANLCCRSVCFALSFAPVLPPHASPFRCIMTAGGRGPGVPSIPLLLAPNNISHPHFFRVKWSLQVGKALPASRLEDCVTVILSYQNFDGGMATYENTRSFHALEVRMLLYGEKGAGAAIAPLPWVMGALLVHLGARRLLQGTEVEWPACFCACTACLGS